MDYPTALHRLMGLVDLERTLAPARERPRYNLSRIRTLLARLDGPQDRVPAVHVTGTKGKGSTCAMVTSILAHCGCRTGLYTSPHLHTMRERIRLGLEPVSEDLFASLVKALWPAVEAMRLEGQRITTFELLTAMAFQLFAQTSQDLQVLEVGLGGTLDATNVVASPLVCILTSISLDHTEVLGSRVEEIAQDKAGIIKPGATAVVAPQPPQAMAVIEAACRERGATLMPVEQAYRWEADSWDLTGQGFRVRGPLGEHRLWLPLLGLHQVENACCAIAAVEALAGRGYRVTPEGVAAGLREVTWPGRLEVLQRQPLVMADAAHNPYSVRRLVEAMQYYFPAQACILVVGATYGHDLEGMAAEAAALRPDLVLATRSRHPRAMPPAQVAKAFRPWGVSSQEVEPVASAIDLARDLAGTQEVVLATGSLFTVAEVRERLLGIAGEVYPELQPRSLTPGVV